MPKHLQRDLDDLKKAILTMGAMVEEAIGKAISALKDQRSEFIDEILNDDDRIDKMELEVEDDCLKILALHRPVASDLRFIVAVMKVNNDLERMGDLAVNIAERASALALSPFKVECSVDFDHMQESVQMMVRESLDSLVNRDPTLARAIVAKDDEIDEANHQALKQNVAEMKKDPARSDCAIQMVLVARHLERIADLATNIAEDVVFMVEGDVIRHSRDEEQ